MAQFISTLSEGSIVKLKENGALVDFYVAKHDYESGLNGTGRTLLARAKPWPTDVVWNNILKNAYADSTIDRWLNNDYKNKLDPSIQAQITETQFYYTVGNGNRNTVPLSRDIFILSGTEYDISADRMATEGKILPIADELLSTRKNEWTRSPRYNLTTSAWRCMEYLSTADDMDVTYAFPVRPVFQLPSTLTVSDDGVIIAPPLAPNSIAVPDTTMQGNTLPVSWTAVGGADSYVLERSADSGAWTQVYSGAELSYTDTAGTWGTVQYRVKAGASGVYGDYTTSAAAAVVPASTCTISGEDGDLGTLTGDIVYTAMTNTTEPITVTETVNGTMLRTFQPVSGAQQRISVMDLPTGGGTAVIKAECSGVSVTRTWTYTKAAADFPAAGTPFDIALLSKGGRVQFPQTLAECVRMPYGDTIGDYMKHWWRRTAVRTVYKYNVDTTDNGLGGEYYPFPDNVKISYSSDITADAAGLHLKSPTTVNIPKSQANSYIGTLKGKFFSYDNGNQIYKFGESLTYKSYEDYFVFYPYYSVERIKITELELHEYVQSNDRNAYPDSGISENYEYQYLGQPFGLDNLLGGAKIATGSYTGTGTYGASSPNSLTFEFEPRVVFVNSVKDTFFAIFQAGVECATSIRTESSRIIQPKAGNLTTSFSGKTLKWYFSDALYQGNGSGYEYKYIAIG